MNFVLQISQYNAKKAEILAGYHIFLPRHISVYNRKNDNFDFQIVPKLSGIYKNSTQFFIKSDKKLPLFLTNKK